MSLELKPCYDCGTLEEYSGQYKPRCIITQIGGKQHSLEIYECFRCEAAKTVAEEISVDEAFKKMNAFHGQWSHCPTCGKQGQFYYTLSIDPDHIRRRVANIWWNLRAQAWNCLSCFSR